MGIIDFREIKSPNPSHESGKCASIGISNLPDDFELFCQEFFAVVRRMRIFEFVSNGADNGIDLGVEETTTDGQVIRWLVSCKHKAHSRTPVSEDEEKNIIERLSRWECDGFIPFYTTLPSAKVDSLIKGVENFGRRVERYFKDRIERELLDSPVGTRIAARYFPRSMVNHYGRIVDTVRAYSVEDVRVDGGVATIAGVSQCLPVMSESELLETKADLTKIANVFATMKSHAPYFTSALCEAINLAPDFFSMKTQPKELKDFVDVSPTWSSYSLYRASVDRGNNRGLAFSYFVAAVWSFWDWSKSNQAFAEMMAFRGEPISGLDLSEDEVKSLMESDDFKRSVERRKAQGLLSPGLVALKLQEPARDVVTRLFAFANPIPFSFD